jgi:hypothetical protein
MEAVRVIYDGIVARRSYSEIARALDEAGYPPPGKDKWRPERVRDIVSNHIYKGDYIYGQKPGRRLVPHTEIPDDCLDNLAVIHRGFISPAPISEEQWTQANKVFAERSEKSRQHRASKPHYLLTRLLFCSSCGSPLHGHRQAHRQRSGRVSMYRHNRPRAGRPPCDHENRYLRAAPLEDVARRATEHFLQSDVLVNEARRALEQLQDNEEGDDTTEALRVARETLDSALEAAIAANVRAAQAVTKTDIEIHSKTVRRMSAAVDEARASVEGLEARGQALRSAAAAIPQLERSLGTLREMYSNGSPEDQKRVVGAVIERMEVHFDTDSMSLRIRAA